MGPGRWFGLLAGLWLASAAPAQENDREERPWSFRPVVRPVVPPVRQADWLRNPIDAFILARLEAEGLAPAPEADRRTLIRRLSFDLLGLPPTPEEIAAFESDPRPDAYERLVDRFLASPHFGEHWALYWLDLVRYAQSDGFKADDPRPTAWRYRDYVIRAFNEDRPYDRFVQEQLAGDELFPEDPQARVATAFLRHFPDEYNARNLRLRRQEILNDLTDTTAAVFLGLTLGCARCHDHKYDPLTQVDYYRFQAFFAAVSPRDDLPLADASAQQRFQEQQQRWLQQTAALRRQLAEIEEPYRQKFRQRNKSKFAPEYQQAYDLPPAQRSPLQQLLAEMVAKQLDQGAEGLAHQMPPAVRARWQALRQQLAAYEQHKPPPLPVTLGVTDIGPQAPPTYVLKRGDYRQPRAEVRPGFPAALTLPGAEVPLSPKGKSTGRRAALACWLTRPDHPLTARVLVNRLWQHHFGRGLVATPSDFGTQGEPPTHPELLDWLAAELIAQGWSLKALHRLMVTSATYRQAPRGWPETLRRDPENRWLGRSRRRRLEGETLRDALLAVSGLLNRKMAGPSVCPELPAELGTVRGWRVTPEVTERQRRSIYVYVKRNLRYPFFQLFDAPDSNETCPRRYVSTSAPQALLLLNSQQVHDWAWAFAGRLLRQAPAEPEAIIRLAFRLALGREPDAAEYQLSRTFIINEMTVARRHREDRPGAPAAPALPAAHVPATVEPAFAEAVAAFCHVLFNLNEFFYVD